jgi:hypothetical protein
LREPISAKPSKYLAERGFNKTKLINVLLRQRVLERHEKIEDKTNSDKENAEYVVKYKVRKKDFEKKIRRIFSTVMDKETKKEEICEEQIIDKPIGKVYYFKGSLKEEGEGGAVGGDGGGMGGATSTFSVGDGTTRGDVGYDVPFGQVQRRSIYGSPKEKEKGKNIDPRKILGKDLNEGKKGRRIYITEEQYNIIMEDGAVGATSTTGVGSMGNYTANGLVLKTADGKEDPCAKAGKIKVKMVMDK